MPVPAIVASLAQAGLGLLGNAVLAKGKEFVEQKLGVDIEAEMGTEQGRIRLQQIQAEREAELHDFAIRKGELNLKELQANLADVANSRDSNARIQESANASWLAKNSGYILDFVIVGCTLLLVALLMFRAIPADNKEIAFAMLGSLLTLCGTVVQWHRGSSSGSSKKDDLLLAAKGKQ